MTIPDYVAFGLLLMMVLAFENPTVPPRQWPRMGDEGKAGNFPAWTYGFAACLFRSLSPPLQKDHPARLIAHDF